MNNLKNRVARLESRNEGHDEGVAELLAIICQSTGYPMPDKLPSGAEMDAILSAILRNAIGTALRPYSEGKK